MQAAGIDCISHLLLLVDACRGFTGNCLAACRYWHTSKHQRALDYGLIAKDNKIFDGAGTAVYEIPKDDNYTGWAGYNESAHVCRISGPLGVVERNSSGLWCI
jgi:hypothetical protein